MMIASEFKLVPLNVLQKHEARVLRGLTSLSDAYSCEHLNDPRLHHALLYYLLFTHWPDVLGADTPFEELFYNRYYWYQRLVKQLRNSHGDKADTELYAREMLKTADGRVAFETLRDIEAKVADEIATGDKEIVVAFSDFSLGEVKRRFGLHMDESTDHFAETPPMTASHLLQETLREGIPLALAIGTEKARSEMIIAPVLLEVRRRASNQVSLFSGVEWNVDPAQGLRGVCDFLISRSPEQLDIEAPIVAVVEAKREDMSLGIGQCLAEMVAAQIFNRDRDNPMTTVYGVVTTGNIWKFLRLVETTAFVDLAEYHIKEVERILGILLTMVEDRTTV